MHYKIFCEKNLGSQGENFCYIHFLIFQTTNWTIIWTLEKERGGGVDPPLYTYAYRFDNRSFWGAVFFFHFLHFHDFIFPSLPSIIPFLYFFPSSLFSFLLHSFTSFLIFPLFFLSSLFLSHPFLIPSPFFIALQFC